MYLPNYKKVKKEYLIDVLVGEKKRHLDRRKLCLQIPPDYNELKIKNCYHDITS